MKKPSDESKQEIKELQQIYKDAMVRFDLIEKELKSLTKFAKNKK